MNVFIVALLARVVVLASARTTTSNQEGLKGRLLTPDLQTLKLLLSEPNGSIGGGNGKGPVGQLHYNLNRDFEERVNPRSLTSDWTWLSTKDGKYAADNGAFVRDGISAAELTAIPFVKNADYQGRAGLLSNYEAVFANKIKFVVEPEHKLTVRADFSVKVKNVEDYPFSKSIVVNATDDPSLASAGISLCSRGKGGLIFSIVATNHGIWAVYERNRVDMVEHPESGDKIFIIFHRLADCESPFEEIDAAITYDRSQNLVHYKLNNVIVHTIKNLGTLPANEPGTLAHTTTRSDLVRVEPKEFTVLVGIMSWTDAQDPNNEAHSLHGQPLTSEDVYDEKAKFVDEISSKATKLWGQGVIMKLHDIQIKLEETAGRDDKNKLEGREGQKVNEQADGKLIVPPPSVDSDEIAQFTGERVPRIENKQDEDDSSFAPAGDESVPEEGGNSRNVLEARRGGSRGGGGARVRASPSRGGSGARRSAPSRSAPSRSRVGSAAKHVSETIREGIERNTEERNTEEGSSEHEPA